jgi:hypothetical protein
MGTRPSIPNAITLARRVAAWSRIFELGFRQFGFQTVTYFNVRRTAEIHNLGGCLHSLIRAAG